MCGLVGGVQFDSANSQIGLNLAEAMRELFKRGPDGGGHFIEAGYRRARKYGGAFGTITQSVDDYYKTEATKATIKDSNRPAIHLLQHIYRSDRLRLRAPIAPAVARWSISIS